MVHSSSTVLRTLLVVRVRPAVCKSVSILDEMVFKLDVTVLLRQPGYRLMDVVLESEQRVVGPLCMHVQTFFCRKSTVLVRHTAGPWVGIRYESDSESRCTKEGNHWSMNDLDAVTAWPRWLQLVEQLGKRVACSQTLARPRQASDAASNYMQANMTHAKQRPANPWQLAAQAQQMTWPQTRQFIVMLCEQLLQKMPLLRVANNSHERACSMHNHALSSPPPPPHHHHHHHQRQTQHPSDQQTSCTGGLAPYGMHYGTSAASCRTYT